MEGVGTTPGLLEVAVTWSGWVSLLDPEVMPDNGTVAPEFSTRMTSLIGSSVGGRFAATALTVTVKEPETVLFAIWPSLTVTVMTALPTAPATGVKLSIPVLFGLA